MASKRDLKDCSKVLAVEGYSDLHFYAEVLEHVGNFDAVYIQQFNGRTELLKKLEAFLTPDLLAEKESVGIILDADDNAPARIQSISSLLQRLTHRSIQHGTWSTGEPKLGFLVVPDGTNAGYVETLVWKAWAADPGNSEAKECVETYLSCMEQHNLRAKRPDKGRVSALLAVKNDEDPRLGPGARAKVFDFDRPEFAGLLQFLQGM